MRKMHLQVQEQDENGKVETRKLAATAGLAGAACTGSRLAGASEAGLGMEDK